MSKVNYSFLVTFLELFDIEFKSYYLMKSLIYDEALNKHRSRLYEKKKQCNKCHQSFTVYNLGFSVEMLTVKVNVLACGYP